MAERLRVVALAPAGALAVLVRLEERTRSPASERLAKLKVLLKAPFSLKSKQMGKKLQTSED